MASVDRHPISRRATSRETAKPGDKGEKRTEEADVVSELAWGGVVAVTPVVPIEPRTQIVGFCGITSTNPKRASRSGTAFADGDGRPSKPRRWSL